MDQSACQPQRRQNSRLSDKSDADLLQNRMRIPNFVDDAQPFTPRFESYRVASIPFALYAAAAALPRRNLMNAPTPADLAAFGDGAAENPR